MTFKWPEAISSASQSVRSQRGESLLQMIGLLSVAKGNCGVVRRREEQPAAKCQSATQVNSIRPAEDGERARYSRSLIQHS
jgi:aspartate carbamoyltransferase catalytic subunit